MSHNNTFSHKVVYLVDNKRRDLAMAALIALQLERRGIECVLEPLESYRAVLAADRPDMIIFNHFQPFGSQPSCAIFTAIA